MFNPYVSTPEQSLRPVQEPTKGLLDGILGRLGRLETDDLMIMVLIYLLVKEEEQDRIWPLVAALIYLML